MPVRTAFLMQPVLGSHGEATTLLLSTCFFLCEGSRTSRKVEPLKDLSALPSSPHFLTNHLLISLWFFHYFKLHILQLLSGLINLFIVRDAETFRNDLSARIRNLIGNYVAQTIVKSWRVWYSFYFNCS